MVRVVLITCVAVSVSGCLLQTEPCGFDFIERDDRCVPQTPAEPYRSSSLPPEGVSPDASTLEPPMGGGGYGFGHPRGRERYQSVEAT